MLTYAGGEFMSPSRYPEAYGDIMRLTGVFVPLFLAAAVTPAAASTVEFVKNGDFTQLSNNVGELGSYTVAADWTSNGYNFVFTSGNVAAPTDNTMKFWTSANGASDNTWNGLTESGSGNFLAMDGDFYTGPVQQTITNLTVGQSYTLSFNYAFAQQYSYYGATWQDLTASLGGFSITLPSAFTDCTGSGDGQSCTGGYALESQGFSGWSTYSTTIVATATTETLAFLAGGNRQVPPFALVSDVSLTGPAAPEPATWATMLVGFAALGFAGFRSSRRKATA